MDDRIVRERERARLTAVSRSAWWEGEKAGRCPKRRRLGAASVGWLLSEIQLWMNSRDAGPAAQPVLASKPRRRANEVSHGE